MRTVLSALFAALALSAVPAHAATAFLQNCTAGSGISGMPAWIGTYSYNGRVFTMEFPMSGRSYCPQSVEI